MGQGEQGDNEDGYNTKIPLEQISIHGKEVSGQPGTNNCAQVDSTPWKPEAERET